MSNRSSFIGVYLLLLFMYESSLNVSAGGGMSKNRPKSPPPRRHPPPPPSHVPLDPHVWCVTKPEARTKEVVAYLKDMCNKRRVKYCEAIRKGQPCYLGGNSRKQASYVLHQVFIDTHSCYGGVGMLSGTNPSEGGCTFPLIDMNRLIAD